jgi:hypothetical protein
MNTENGIFCEGENILHDTKVVFTQRFLFGKTHIAVKHKKSI